MTELAVWVVILHFASGAIEPTFAYKTEGQCKAQLSKLLGAGKDIKLGGECVEFKQAEVKAGNEHG